MPKPSQTVEPEVTATVSDKLNELLILKMINLVEAREELEQAKTALETAETDIELAFLDADEEAAMLAGVKIDVPGVGKVPFKKITGGRSSSLDKDALMKRFKITPAQWAAHMKSSPKADYYYYRVPKDKVGK